MGRVYIEVNVMYTCARTQDGNRKSVISVICVIREGWKWVFHDAYDALFLPTRTRTHAPARTRHAYRTRKEP